MLPGSEIRAAQGAPFSLVFVIVIVIVMVIVILIVIAIVIVIVIVILPLDQRHVSSTLSKPI